MASTQIIAAGGTISSLPQPNGDFYAELTGEPFLQRYGITEDVRIQASVTKGSFAFDYETLHTIASDVLMAGRLPDISGMVVTHGTDTMEETAFFVSLVAGGLDKPIVFTGSQLAASDPSSDGTRNLADAIRVAQSTEAALLNTVVVFAGFIHAAREVQKVDTSALQAFDSPGWGPIGRVDGAQVSLARTVRPRSPLQLAIPEPVALIRLGVGMTGQEFRHMADGYQAVVVEAFGRGNAHPTLSPEVLALTKLGIPVVVTSRCAHGSVLPIYGGGGGKDLVRAGAWFAGDLKGEKARLLLGLLLANGVSLTEMEQLVQQYSTP